MAITTRAGLITAMGNGQIINVLKVSAVGQTAGRYLSTFRMSGRPDPNASSPSVTGNTLSSASPGALSFVNPPSGLTYVGQHSMAGTTNGVALLIDLMLETGGLNATITTAQTVGSVALPTRAGAGVGCTVALQCYSAVGAATSTPVTISYTNSSGVAGRTATVPGGIPGYWQANQLLPATLQTGDVGVQSVQSVTSAISTTLAGNFGVVIYTRISEINLPTTGTTTMGWAETGLPTVLNDACLGYAVLPTGTSSPQIVGSLNLIQG